MSSTIDSMLLSSTNPDRLRQWYVTTFQPDIDELKDQYHILGLGGFYLMIDTRDDIGAKNPEPGRLILNVDVDDAAAAVARAESVGVEWLAPLEDRDGSYFATAIDPDGNYVQLVQLSEQAKAEMGG